jgi:hypothetical protein
LKPVQKPQKIMRRKKNTNTVSIRHWEQVSFLPKIVYPVVAQIPTLPRADGGNASTPDIGRQVFSRSIRKPNKH